MRTSDVPETGAHRHDQSERKQKLERGRKGGGEEERETKLRSQRPKTMPEGKHRYSCRIEVIVSLSLSLPAPLASYYSRDVCSDDCVMESDGKTNRDHIGGLSFQREPFAFQMRSSVL